MGLKGPASLSKEAAWKVAALKHWRTAAHGIHCLCNWDRQWGVHKTPHV